MEQEIWKEIKGYEGYYEVSNLGRFRSMDRIISFSNGRKVFYKGKIINGSIEKDGYICVKLSKNGNNETKKLHRLIAQTFMPVDNSDNLEVNHIDFNRINNRINNLEWVSHIDNIHHSSKKGR